MAMHQKSFNVDIDEKISDAFSAQVEQQGYVKYRAIEGALRVFMSLPLELQSQFISNDIDDVYTTLVRGLVDAEIQKHLDELGPAKEKFLALLKQAIKPKQRKR